ncbi:hypothetical protein BJX76DRAFT_368192 [Aspergillus varians]
MALNDHPSTLWCLWNALRGLNNTFLTKAQVPVPDLKGKWIIITGSNNGIGFEVAKSFAEAGANLILGCRDPPAWERHPNTAVEMCKESAHLAGHTTTTIEGWEINMDDLDSVDAFGKRWLVTGRPLDILCNNAGMSPTASTKPVLTTDGLEILHQVNFASHVLLTLWLLESLAQSPEPRIICTTSCVHFTGKFDLEHFNGEDGMAGHHYSNNKLYLQTWLVELQNRLLCHTKYKHITVNGVHPGYVNSGIWNVPRSEVRDTWLDPRSILLKPLAAIFGITPEQGSRAIVYVATSPEFGPNPDVQGVGMIGGKGGGHYINRIWEAEAMPQCTDAEARLAVWEKVGAEVRLADRGLGQLI